MHDNMPNTNGIYLNSQIYLTASFSIILMNDIVVQYQLYYLIITPYA